MIRKFDKLVTCTHLLVCSASFVSFLIRSNHESLVCEDLLNCQFVNRHPCHLNIGRLLFRHPVRNSTSRVQILLQTETLLLSPVPNMVSLPSDRCPLFLTHSLRLAPLIGTNDILGEYVEAVALEVINDQGMVGLPIVANRVSNSQVSASQRKQHQLQQLQTRIARLPAGFSPINKNSASK